MSQVTSQNALVKDSTVQTLNGKLDNLNATLGGNANIAPVFNTATAYSKGDMVNYNGDLYVFTANHSAGAWTGSDAVQTKVSSELSSLRSGLTELSGDFTEHHTTSLSEVTYYKCGKLVFVTLSSVTLSNGTSLGVPAAGNNVVLTLRDESAGGISQVVMSTDGSIASGAGSTSFTDGHSYSGTVMYVSAQ